MAQGVLQETAHRQYLVVAGFRAKQGRAAEIYCSNLSHSPQRALFSGKTPKTSYYNGESGVLQQKVPLLQQKTADTATESLWLQATALCSV